MNNKLALIISATVVVVLAGLVALFSIFYVQKGGSLMAMGAELRNTIEIPLSQADSLLADYGSKDLDVYVWQEDKIVIKEYLNSGRSDAKATVEFEDNKAVVTGGRWAWNLTNLFFWGSINERIEIYLPTQGIQELELHTGSGNIRAQENFSIETQGASIQAGSGNINWKNTKADKIIVYANSGNLRVDELKGNISLHTGSGNITAKEIEGEVTAEAGSGNITIEQLSGSCEAEAGSGNLKVSAEEITGDISLQTGSGNQRLELPEMTSFSLQVNTGSGNIHTDYDEYLDYNKKGNQVTGQVGDAPVCRITSSAGSGNVTIKRS